MTTFHVGYDLSFLIRLPDEELLDAVKGGTASEMRAALVCMRAAGKTMLVPRECDRQDPEGRCLGHPETEKT
jgi:hypothetical protein